MQPRVEEAPTVRGEVEAVTPGQAAKWLEARAPNRTVQSRIALSMARDMAAGRWQVTHQGIAFDVDGRLLDGQHRLSAIIIANREVAMMVTRGLPRETQLVIDDHRRRSGADVLTIEQGYVVDAVAVALLRLMDRQPGVVSGHGARFTKSEMADAYAMHRDAVAFVQDSLKTSHVRGVTTAPALAPVARAYYTEDRARLASFLRVLASGIPDHPTQDVAALRLRDWLIEHRDSGHGGAKRGEAFGRSQWALRKFLDREDVKTVRLAKEDLFPVPEDVSPRSVASARLRAVRS